MKSINTWPRVCGKCGGKVLLREYEPDLVAACLYCGWRKPIA